MLIQIIDEIKKSIDNECYIAALMLALSIPDICGKAEYSHASTTSRYIQWYNTYVGKYEKPLSPYDDDMPYASGELIYNLRNSLFHQGTPNIDVGKVKEERCRVDEFRFTISDVTDGGLSCVSYGKECQIDKRIIEVNIVNLCSNLSRAARYYYTNNKDKFNFFNYELKDVRKSYTTLFKFKDRL